ncbi:amidoligase family protein [Azospirillum sp.]|uniref:amidoligase family protein n=1 Tax=Azospirillum sp. TaxID=34012 RepID=UPI002D6E664E|nr:amidoligase family protein [Azospirillum sp.]HYD66365.1 amidoligase family protein [Azospirillum sp.]
MDSTLHMPPRLTTPDGSPRRVGVELEFADLDAPSAARLVRELYGGTIEVEDPHRCRVTGTRLGDFTVELDMRSAHPEKKADADAETEPGALDTMLEKLRPLWGRIGSLVMPFEIAAPPVPFDRLPELEALIRGLRERGAAGTEASPLFAFGLHFNPEVAADDADYLVDHLKAFLILSPWLRSEIQVDPTRRLTGFIAAFPIDYAAKVVDPAYRPDRAALIADYLAANPTRNRELDLFPLFAHLAPDTLFAAVKDPHVRPRPTFHYRLPNARIGDPGWSLAQDWNRWVTVEELAADRGRLDSLGAAYRDFAQRKDLDGWAAEAGQHLAGQHIAGRLAG